MAPFLLELAQLEVEPLEVICVPESEQDSGLDTLITQQGEAGITTVLTLKGNLPVNGPCCCCCPALCCCCCQ